MITTALAVIGLALLTFRIDSAGMSRARPRNRELVTRVCAWCTKVKMEGESWRSERRHVAPPQPGALLTHGICPVCFDRMA